MGTSRSGLPLRQPRVISLRVPRLPSCPDGSQAAPREGGRWRGTIRRTGAQGARLGRLRSTISPAG